VSSVSVCSCHYKERVIPLSSDIAVFFYWDCHLYVFDVVLVLPDVDLTFSLFFEQYCIGS
jgi:hypothetical protein